MNRNIEPSPQLLFVNFSLYRPIISGKIRDLRKFSHNYRHISGLQPSASLCQGILEPEAKTFTSALQRLDSIHSNLSYPFSRVSFEYFNHEKLCWTKAKQKQKANKRILLESEYFPWHRFCWLWASRADPRTWASTPLTVWIHGNFQGSVAAWVERGTGVRPRIRLEIQATPHPYPQTSSEFAFFNSPSSSSFL